VYSMLVYADCMMPLAPLISPSSSFSLLPIQPWQP
jgi:hypothetical protein